MEASFVLVPALRQYNEIHVFTKPSSSTCQVCVSRGGQSHELFMKHGASVITFFDGCVKNSFDLRMVIITNCKLWFAVLIKKQLLLSL